MCPSGRTLAAETAVSTDLWPAFDALDADHDGRISLDDLRNFYSGISSTGADEDAINTMISVADLNKDGFVEYDEFERVLSSKKRSGGVMEDVFKIMDKDGDGKLSVDDLKSCMEWAGFSVSDEEVKAMIRLGGADETEGVSYDDLLKILTITNNVF